MKRRIFNLFSFCLSRVSIVVVLFFSLHATAAIVTRDQFGLHLHGLARQSTWPSVDFGFIRLWDSGTNWNQLEPYKGQWNFSDLDRYVEAATSSNVKVLITLGQTPQWAASDPDADSPYAPGASSPPKNIEDWRNYVRILGERYKGRITHWEIWNEIDVKHFYSGDMRSLVALEREAVSILKGIDPSNVVLTPSVQSGAFRKFEAYLSAGGGRYADIISYHFYVPKDDPEDIPPFVIRVREILKKYGLESKPIWNTEAGWLIENSDGGFGKQQRPVWSSWRRLKANESADIVLRAYLVNFGMGVSHFFWYAWDNGAMGLSEDKGRRPKRASKGYEVAYRWLVGSDFLGCSQSDLIHVCRIVREGKFQYLVWSKDKTSYNLPKEWSVSGSENVDGVIAPVQSRTLDVGPSPLRFFQ